MSGVATQNTLTRRYGKSLPRSMIEIDIDLYIDIDNSTTISQARAGHPRSTSSARDIFVRRAQERQDWSKWSIWKECGGMRTEVLFICFLQRVQIDNRCASHGPAKHASDCGTFGDCGGAREREPTLDEVGPRECSAGLRSRGSDWLCVQMSAPGAATQESIDLNLTCLALPSSKTGREAGEEDRWRREIGIRLTVSNLVCVRAVSLPRPSLSVSWKRVHLLDRTVAPNSETYWWKLADKSRSAKTASSSFSLQSKSSVEHNVRDRLGGFRNCWCPIASDLRSLRKVKRDSLDEVCSTGIQNIRLQLPYFITSCEVQFSRERCWADTNSAGEHSQTVSLFSRVLLAARASL